MIKSEMGKIILIEPVTLLRARPLIKTPDTWQETKY